jgi:NADPH:quinone reductase
MRAVVFTDFGVVTKPYIGDGWFAEYVVVPEKGGGFVSTPLGSPDQLPADGVTVVRVYANPTTVVLDRLADSRAKNDLRVTVQRRYPLDEGPRALADFGGGTLGKLVITTD